MAFEKITSKLQWNKKLLPIKGHYFFFNAGTAPLVPYLSTYARQLGFSSATVGLIYTVLPIFGLVAKPLFGVIADRFKIQKSLFIFFQIVTIVSFSAIYFIPAGEQAVVTVGLGCYHPSQELSTLKSCHSDNSSVDLCKVTTLQNQNDIAMCKMNCDMSSPILWQHVCENWGIPDYCYSNSEHIGFTTYLDKVTMKDGCAYISATNVTIDGHTYTPGCRMGADSIVIDEPCRMRCNAQLTDALSEHVHLTCVDHTLNYRACANVTQIEMLSDSLHSSSCEIYCDLNKSKPWKLLELCRGWEADEAGACHQRLPSGELFPRNLSFVGAVPLSRANAEHNCISMPLDHIQLPGGEIHYPRCVSNDTNQTETEYFQTSCAISCDNELVNELFAAASDGGGSSQYTRQFWLFFLMMIISWVGQAVVVTFADAICFNLLGSKVSRYGKQRLWGSVGWGIFSLLTGSLIDALSAGAVKDYSVAFVLMFLFLAGDVVVSSFVQIESTKMSMSILADVGSLVSSPRSLVFLAWTVAVGLCTGLLWQFLFWLLEDTAALSCDGTDYVKTLQGLVSAIQTFCGEIPFLFVSGYLLRKVGHVHMMSVVLLGFGARFLLYSWLRNPWWALPVELLQGVTFGMFYPTMTSYANIVSPPGTETTVQGLVGAIFEGVGVSLGSFIGGRLYEAHGGWNTFRWFGYGALVCCCLHAAAQHALRDRSLPAGVPQTSENGDADSLHKH